MTNRLLLVEPSATMRYVLEKHAQSLGFAVDATESYASAMNSLSEQYQQYGTEYSGMLLGWPTTPDDEATALAALLEQSEYKDLPVVVMSTDMRAETRAWVAGRDNTAVLSWKEYQDLDALLQRLIDVAPDDAGTFAAKFDNSDIHLLVVDDSATIRFSLQELFQMQGYQVTLASTQIEAMDLARRHSFDIAVLDFYLTETTGDLLCRELMGSVETGDIVCTVLTGTYSDHIIKRSLRAGAVECMFKNESSELLLSRIDAISRFVRQQRQFKNDRVLLEEVIDSVAGAFLVINPDHKIVYVSPAAKTELQLESTTTMVGQLSETLLEVGGPKPPGSGLHSVKWRLSGGGSIGVDYEHLRIEASGRSLIRFARNRIAVEKVPVSVQSNSAKNAVSLALITQKLNLAKSSEPILTQLDTYLASVGTIEERISLFVIDVFIQDTQGVLTSVKSNTALENKVSAALQGLYRRPGHVATMSDNRYAILMRHKDDTRGYLLVRKIMQLCLGIKHEDAIVACTGSMLSVNDNATLSSLVLMQHAFKGVELVNSRAPNQALLLDLRRMLTAYPVTEASKTKPSGS